MKDYSHFWCIGRIPADCLPRSFHAGQRIIDGALPGIVSVGSNVENSGFAHWLCVKPEQIEVAPKTKKRLKKLFRYPACAIRRHVEEEVCIPTAAG